MRLLLDPHAFLWFALGDSRLVQTALDLILDATQAKLVSPARLDLQAHSQQYCHTAVAMSPDGRLFGLSSRTELRVADRHGAVLHRLTHNAWDAGSSCFFDLNGRLWYIRPGSSPGLDDCLIVLEPYSGAILAAQTIPNPVGYFFLFPCPDHESALIDLGCGQDGSYLYLARLAGAGLAIEEYPFSNRTFFGGFSPDGREFATGAHDGASLMVHCFPSGRVVASIENETLFSTDSLSGELRDDVGYQVIFIDDDHLLAQTGFGRMILLDRGKMRLLGTVWPSGGGLRGYDESGRETDDPSKIVGYESGLSSLHSAGIGKVLTVYHKERVVRLLDVSPLLSAALNPD